MHQAGKILVMIEVFCLVSYHFCFLFVEFHRACAYIHLPPRKVAGEHGGFQFVMVVLQFLVLMFQLLSRHGEVFGKFLFLAHVDNGAAQYFSVSAGEEVAFYQYGVFLFAYDDQAAALCLFCGQNGTHMQVEGILAVRVDMLVKTEMTISCRGDAKQFTEFLVK